GQRAATLVPGSAHTTRCEQGIGFPPTTPTLRHPTSPRPRRDRVQPRECVHLQAVDRVLLTSFHHLCRWCQSSTITIVIGNRTLTAVILTLIHPCNITVSVLSTL